MTDHKLLQTSQTLAIHVQIKHKIFPTILSHCFWLLSTVILHENWCFFIKIILYSVCEGVKTVSVIYVTINIEQKMDVLSSKPLWFNISLDSTSFFLNSSNGCCIEWRVLAWFKRTFYNFPIVSTWLDNLVVIRDYLQQINMHLFSGLSQINLLYIKAHKSYFIFAWFNARHAATYSMS